MSKHQKLSCVQLEDLPDEIIVKIFSYVDIKEILRLGQLSRRIRAISSDDSLWLQLNLKGYVPYELLEKAVENGCRYLSLAFGCLYECQRSEMPLKLKYLEMTGLSGYLPGSLKIPDMPKVLLKNCHSLQKLAVEHLILDSEDIEHICQNGQTLKVLNLSSVQFWTDYPTLELFKKCVELTELNLSRWYDFLDVNAILSNLTSKILKLDLSCNGNLEDHHLKALVERCNKITELDLGSTSITKESVGSIVTHLKSLEKLDVSYTKIDSTALYQLGSVKTLMFLRWQNIEIDKNIDQIRNLKKKLPQLSINANYLSNIATSTSNTVQYEDGFWEIKARSQELFLK